MHLELPRHPAIPSAAPLPKLLSQASRSVFGLCVPELCRQMRNGFNIARFCDWQPIQWRTDGAWRFVNLPGDKPVPTPLQAALDDIGGDWTEMYTFCDEHECFDDPDFVIAEVKRVVLIPDHGRNVYASRDNVLRSEIYDALECVLNGLVCRLQPCWQQKYREVIGSRWRLNNDQD